MQDKIIEKLKRFNNIAILGYGKEGISTYNFIRKYDKDIKLTILDAREITPDDDNTLYKKYNGEDSLKEFDLIIKTPGVPILGFSKDTISKITSQMELLLEVNSSNVIGITGTKGKSTTSTLIYDILSYQMDKVFLVGNIGIPVLDKIDEYDGATIVAEMSSHQLETVKVSPHIGIILNLYSDHLDHAGTLENYHASKMNIIRHQQKTDYAIYDLDNEYLKCQDFSSVLGNKLTVSLNKKATIYLKDNNIYLNDCLLLKREEIITSLLGDNNLKNIMFALLVASLYNLDINKALISIKNFKPLEHRMEYVGKYKDINFYNDAIATIPEATISACQTLTDVDTLIFGGMDRGIDYTKLIDYLNNSNIKHLICMPSTGHKLAKFLDKNKVILVDDLNEAVEKAFLVTEKGKTCIMSPAASSYEYFKNFEEKGNAYKKLVRTHK